MFAGPAIDREWDSPASADNEVNDIDNEDDEEDNANEKPIIKNEINLLNKKPTVPQLQVTKKLGKSLICYFL